MSEISNLFKTDSSIRIYLLGEFRVIGAEGRDITPTASKARAILAMLALSENGEVARERLVQLLWSRHAREQAQASLRQSLGVLRRTFRFETQDFFTADRNKVYLKKTRLWIDSDEIVNNAPELLKRNMLAKVCCGSALNNLEANDPAFNAWLGIKKKALEEDIKSVLLAILRDTDSDESDEKKHKAVLAGLKNIDPSNHFALQQLSTATDHHGEICLSRDELLYRDCLLKNVARFWIEGVLEQSLYKKTRIELQLKETSEQMLQAWPGMVQCSVSSNKLRRNSEIGEIFSELNESMLILGAPGSGKTTLLLCLAQQLLKRAEEDSRYPIPVIFHLATWAKERSSLDVWLEEELKNRYQMPGKQSARLIRMHGILPLLDGLDEVDAFYRTDCVNAINNFRQQNTWLSMVVCCREEDYKKLPLPVITAGKVLIHALTENQCDAYLQAIEGPNQGLNAALAEDKRLKELLTTPLMLNIASIAYQDYARNLLPPKKSLGDIKDQLFSAYTQAMLSRRTADKTGYNKDNTCHWLACLARSLDEEKQSIFYVDSMQPGRLATEKQYRMVTQGSVMICALSVALVLGLMGSLVMPLKYSFGISLVFGGIGGYITGLMGYGDHIRPLVHIKLSWAALRSVSAIKQIGTVAICGMLGLAVTLVFDPVLGSMLGLFFYILCLLINSIDFESDCKHQSPQADPNENIYKSFRNAAIALAIAGTVGFVSAFFIAGLKGGMVVGLLAALLSALFFGAHTCIQHYLLRYFLWRNNTTPFNYVRFLEFSVDRIFLYRVGRGYIFIHRSLAEHFAKTLSSSPDSADL